MRYAVINRKGGVYKTTLALLLAQHLASSGRRVLVVDCDVDQGNAIEWLLGRADFECGVVYEVNGIAVIWVSKEPDFLRSCELSTQYDDVVFDGRPSGLLARELAAVAEIVLIPHFGRGDKTITEETAKLVRRVNPMAHIVVQELPLVIPFYPDVQRDGWAAVGRDYTEKANLVFGHLYHG